MPARGPAVGAKPGRVTVVGLGPAGPDLVLPATLVAVEAVHRRFVRTTLHPAVEVVPHATSFDAVYEQGDSLEEVYGAIVERLVVEARAHGHVLYAVPGSPRVGERTVELLVADGRAEVDVLPALSFLDLAWSRLSVDPVVAGVRVVDGRRFVTEAAGERGPLLVAQCDTRAVLSEVKLAVDDPPASAVVMQRLGSGDEVVAEVDWADLDRAVVPDHLTSLYLPELAAPVAAELVAFVELVRTLRDRCPWDREQTHASLTRYLVEEAYEVLEAIDALDQARGAGALADAYDHLEDELGDVLFQVVFHATLGTEAGRFTLADVARGIHDKLVRRHPHVFAGVAVSGTGDVVRNWERIKREETGRAGVMEGVPTNLPALLFAHKVQRKAAALGVDVEPRRALDLAAVATGEDVGEALFTVVATARRLGLDPEAALRATAARFRRDVAAQEASGSGALGSEVAGGRRG